MTAKQITDSRYCTKPDRHVPGLQCGFQLPCPYHTVTINTQADPATILVPITSAPAQDKKLLGVLKEIGKAIIEESAGR